MSCGIRISLSLLLLSLAFCRGSAEPDKSKEPKPKPQEAKGLSLDDACRALQEIFDIPPDSELGKILKKKDFTYDKRTGYYSAGGYLDFSLRERIFYMNRGPRPKGAPDIQGSFYLDKEGRWKARGDTP